MNKIIDVGSVEDCPFLSVDHERNSGSAHKHCGVNHWLRRHEGVDNRGLTCDCLGFDSSDCPFQRFAQLVVWSEAVAVSDPVPRGRNGPATSDSVLKKCLGASLDAKDWMELIRVVWQDGFAYGKGIGRHDTAEEQWETCVVKRWAEEVLRDSKSNSRHKGMVQES